MSSCPKQLPLLSFLSEYFSDFFVYILRWATWLPFLVSSVIISLSIPLFWIHDVSAGLYIFTFFFHSYSSYRFSSHSLPRFASPCLQVSFPLLSDVLRVRPRVSSPLLSKFVFSCFLFLFFQVSFCFYFFLVFLPAASSASSQARLYFWRLLSICLFPSMDLSTPISSFHLFSCQFPSSRSSSSLIYSLHS